MMTGLPAVAAAVKAGKLRARRFLSKPHARLASRRAFDDRLERRARISRPYSGTALSMQREHRHSDPRGSMRNALRWRSRARAARAEGAEAAPTTPSIRRADRSEDRRDGRRCESSNRGCVRIARGAAPRDVAGKVDSVTNAAYESLKISGDNHGDTVL